MRAVMRIETNMSLPVPANIFFQPRHILAALHFNQNLVRDVKKKASGSSQVKLNYPKFKNGVASVRDVRIQPNYGVLCLGFLSLSKALFSHYITSNNISLWLEKNKRVKLLIQR